VVDCNLGERGPPSVLALRCMDLVGVQSLVNGPQNDAERADLASSCTKQTRQAQRFRRAGLRVVHTPERGDDIAVGDLAQAALPWFRHPHSAPFKPSSIMQVRHN